MCYFLSVIVAVCMAFVLPKGEGSLFHTDWHFVCHFSIMVLGGIAFLKLDARTFPEAKTDNNSSAIGHIRDWAIFLTSFILYFVIMRIGKGQTDWRYYIQVIALLPLQIFCWYAYKMFSCEWCKKLMTNRRLGWPFMMVSSLTLEIYVVQFHVITDRFNRVFPLNTVIVFCLICIAAYLLRILVNLFVQFMSKDDWNWKNVVNV